jgi:Tfp pilus assembly protein PilF
MRQANPAGRPIAAVACGLFSLVASAEAKSPPPHIATGCASPAQKSFDAGLTLLHSFEYVEARRKFTESERQDPDCAMAKWGLAMTLWHPLWAPPAKADLEKGARLLDNAIALADAGESRAYVDALRSFFSSADPATHRDRVGAYEAKMRTLHLADPGDREAALFYALALLAGADPHDATYARQFRAGAILNLAEAGAPDHPAVLHYTIHAYDYPSLAYLALPAALRYADAAPESAHAQHMPSHIFTRLGMWDRAISSNRDSTRSAADYSHRAHLDGHYDEGLHSIDYLTYALLQTGRDAAAAIVLDELAAIEKPNENNFKAAFTYASSPARFVVERGAWSEAADLKAAPASFPWAEFPWAMSIIHFARGLGAAKVGDIDAAEAEAAEIARLEASLAPSTLAYWREQVGVQKDSVRAAILFANHRPEEALSLAAAAADREDAVDKHPVTPGEIMPAREFYAQMLSDAGRAKDALAQFRTALSRAPNRLNAQIGAAKAAHAAGESQIASAFLRAAKLQAENGDRKIAPLD